ncbi:MAG: glycosyltransferase family 4 protein [Acidobacteriota bacterium]
MPAQSMAAPAGFVFLDSPSSPRQPWGLMRIVEIETFGRGGLAHYVDNLSRALADLGHEVHVITAVDDELSEAPGKVRRHRRIAPWSGRWAPRLPKTLARLLLQGEALVDALRTALAAKRLRPDVVHLHCTNQIALVYLFWLRTVRLRVAYTAHVVTPHERIPLQSAIYGRVHALCHLIVAHSSFDRRRLQDEFGVERERIAQIPHGEYGFFDQHEKRDRGLERRKLGLAEADAVVLFFGYIREYKGLDLLLEAWPHVAESCPAARLLIAGDPVNLPPARREELQRKAREFGAVDHFGYVPFEDVAGYFAAADALVMPYRAISQSGVLFLALSLGLPVVATAVGALPEMLEDGESALLVPPLDVPALGQALATALDDTELRARLSRGGLAVAADHSWESIAERTQVRFEAIRR